MAPTETLSYQNNAAISDTAMICKKLQNTMMRLRWYLSATMPANKNKINAGANWANPINPRSNGSLLI